MADETMVIKNGKLEVSWEATPQVNKLTYTKTQITNVIADLEAKLIRFQAMLDKFPK